ncbi:hypothetical protein RIR_jg32157.t1 [Rhizophagus irregularis DAOM 181602=DAOM 197198]|nr:hypothetical protein RIR_jg32157.t1 [Rhizophagus irregularis DAOM 181602=DAOM 197198]CAB5386794.1 unnamed protein product [Rhizophagus irregularis]
MIYEIRDDDHKYDNIFLIYDPRRPRIFVDVDLGFLLYCLANLITPNAILFFIEILQIVPETFSRTWTRVL